MSTDTQASRDGQVQGELEPGGKECRLCDIAPAILGLAAAAVITFVSIDLLKGGALTIWALRLFGKGGPADDSADDGTPAD